MKLLSFTHAGRESWGLLEGAEVLDLGARPAFEAPTLIEALRGDDLMGIAMNSVGLAPDHKLDDVDLLPPIPQPPRIIRFDGDSQRPGQSAPSSTTRAPGRNSVSAAVDEADSANDEISWRPGLAAVVGYDCARVPTARAPEVIAGYTCYADGPAAWGPYLITPDEFRETSKGQLTALVNGDRVLNHPVAELADSLHTLVSRESFSAPMRPGDLLVVLAPRPAHAASDIWSPGGTDQCEVTMPIAGSLRRSQFRGIPQIPLGKQMSW
ncbi:hypothetical protein [Streptomyces sp. OE57]|uniref:hypothetical protein n=1 Tax=Streptomyces lacaronensis TaxID=3379885 RepID=UPI0039B72164